MLFSLQPAWAQSIDEAEQWYQVEVIIFARDGDATTDEIWPDDLGLKYPDLIVSLLPPESELESKTNALDETLSDWSADNITLATEPTNISIDNNEVSLSSINQALQNNSNNSTLDTGFSESSDAESVTEQPFILLAPDQYQLGDAAKRLFRQRGIRKLFHETWRQPMGPRDDTESVVIRGGDSFDNHFELEGSITLAQERYLHIHTDLWLSTFVGNSGLDGAMSTVLPKLPITLNSPIIDVPHPSLSDPLSINESVLPKQSQGISTNWMDDISNNLFAVEQTVALRQQRRMRSGEIHYIDHPLMGLLVKVTPYEFPLPEELVEDEVIDESNEPLNSEQNGVGANSQPADLNDGSE